MRLTIELEDHEGANASDVAAELHPYVGRCNEQTRWRGARASITFFGDPHASVDIEAPLDVMRRILATLGEQLDMLEALAADKIRERGANELPCDVCGTWVDRRRPAAWGHADGKGRICLGDGRVLRAPRDGEEAPVMHYDGSEATPRVEGRYDDVM